VAATVPRCACATARTIDRPSPLPGGRPAGNLDSVAGAVVLDLLRARQAAGTTVVIITHDPAIAESLPRWVEIIDGMIVA